MQVSAAAVVVDGGKAAGKLDEALKPSVQEPHRETSAKPKTLDEAAAAAIANSFAAADQFWR